MTEFLIVCLTTFIYYVLILGFLFVIGICGCVLLTFIEFMRYEIAIFMHKDVPEDISELTDELLKRLPKENINNQGV